MSSITPTFNICSTSLSLVSFKAWGGGPSWGLCHYSWMCQYLVNDALYHPWGHPRTHLGTLPLPGQFV